jgi:DNA-binding SARP family transcriptional activator
MSGNMLRLLTFGGLAIVREDGADPPRPRPQRLAILAVLAAAGNRGVSRERMSALFWPDADPDKARHSLRQALYALRQELGAEVVRSESILSIDANELTSDIADFREAVARQDSAAASTFVTGAFLQGFSVPGLPDFDRWIDDERGLVTAETSRVLLALAKQSDADGDSDAATEAWRRLTLLDPLSGRFALGYLKALAASGDRAGALAFARSHESLVKRELEADPDPAIRRLEAELRALPTPAVSRTAPSPERESVATVSAPAQFERAAHASRWRRSAMVVSAAALITAVLLNTGALRAAFGGGRTEPPTFAVGLILEEGVPDSLRIGGVLSDMLSTNLARVGGLSVLANSRLLELMVPGQDTTVAGYSLAARRARANEILQGRLLAGPEWSLALEIQRVDLASGIVKNAYRVSAANRYALIDSMTAAIARDLRLDRPQGSIADATTDSPIAYRLYEEGLRAYYQYDAAAARRLMEAALVEDSTFAMAAYYHAILSFGDAGGTASGLRALRLAARAPEHQRLLITTRISHDLNDPMSVFVAESLLAKYPDDPIAHEITSRVQFWRGDFPAAVRNIERAIALDSASEPAERQACRLCNDILHLATIYEWWDSLDAADRTARRSLRLRPRHHGPWDVLVRTAAVRGDTSALRSHFARFHEANPIFTSPLYFLRYQILVEEYDEASAALRPFLTSLRHEEGGSARWLESISLRNQGRLAEALPLTRVQPGPNDIAEALISIELGNPRAAAAIFSRRAHADVSIWAPGVAARNRTWETTLYAMALIAAGDTARVRALVDTVAFWGRRSAYGRDRKLHHYLQGMLHVAQGRDEDAATELRLAINSPAHGFTRINYELGRVLVRLNRLAEAVPVVQAALHGSIDGSNLYITRTDLHELLAQVFDRLGQRDSATVHYRAVVRAWDRADPVYHARRDSARIRLSALLR